MDANYFSETLGCMPKPGIHQYALRFCHSVHQLLQSATKDINCKLSANKGSICHMFLVKYPIILSILNRHFSSLQSRFIFTRRFNNFQALHLVDASAISFLGCIFVFRMSGFLIAIITMWKRTHLRVRGWEHTPTDTFITGTPSLD